VRWLDPDALYGPLLRHVRRAEPVGPILGWEGSVIDPIIGTLARYGIGAGPLARALGVVRADPQGVLSVDTNATLDAAAGRGAGCRSRPTRRH
jgi:hypothetical protein